MDSSSEVTLVLMTLVVDHLISLLYSYADDDDTYSDNTICVG